MKRTNKTKEERDTSELMYYIYRVVHVYLDDFESGCGIQVSQATHTKFSMPFKHNYGKLS